MNYRLKSGEKTFEISSLEALKLDVTVSSTGQIHIIHQNKSYLAVVHKIDTVNKTVEIELNNRHYVFDLEDELDQLIDKMGLKNIENQISKEIKAPMPGLLLDVMVEIGQKVEKGDSLLILEAMKMENVIKAESESIVKDVHLKKGATVEKNQILITFE